jgi:multimeric flavodoxin WrbA
MIMKIISIVGSPHGKKGNTARLLDEVLEGAVSQGAKNETVILKGDTVLPCRGCDRCHIKGGCAQKDEFNAIKQKICDADGLILASPNYIFSVSAQLKAFMDRCCGVLHCMEFEGKYGASVVTSGGGDEKPILDYMNHFLITTGIHPVGGVLATMGSLKDDIFTEEICRQAFALGEKLVLSWKRKKRSKSVEKKLAAFRERMQWLMIYRKDQWPYEYRFWQKHKGLK